MAIRIIIWKVFCRVATSEVSRVTMEAVENLSMLEKLKSCTVVHVMAQVFAKPVPALDAKAADRTPKASEARAHSTRVPDLAATTCMFCSLMP